MPTPTFTVGRPRWLNTFVSDPPIDRTRGHRPAELVDDLGDDRHTGLVIGAEDLAAVGAHDVPVDDGHKRLAWHERDGVDVGASLAEARSAMATLTMGIDAIERRQDGL